MYAAQLSWWLQHVRPQQLHVINQDDLSAEPQRVLAEVLAFLGVPQDLGLIARLLKGKVRSPPPPLCLTHIFNRKQLPHRHRNLPLPIMRA